MVITVVAQRGALSSSNAAEGTSDLFTPLQFLPTFNLVRQKEIIFFGLLFSIKCFFIEKEQLALFFCYICIK